HAAACRYGGARPGVMGAGLYLLWPAFYTDVSDAYRLSRWSRLRVDLGGMYFNAVFAVGAMALYWASGSDALLIIVPLQLLQMLMCTFGMLVIVLPRLAATTWDSLGFRWTALTAAYGKGDIYTAGATVLTMGALALPLLSISYLISRTVRRIVRRVWHDTEGRPGRRALAALAGAGIVALLVSAWIPDRQRTPIATDEPGTLPVP